MAPYRSDPDAEEDPDCRNRPFRCRAWRCLACVRPLQGHYNFSWYAGYPSWSYSICHYETRPLTLKIWDPYTYSYYFKTVYRDVRICG
jgi:hypothetical protein